jgi:hypothetical protein
MFVGYFICFVFLPVLLEILKTELADSYLLGCSVACNLDECKLSKN